jgi:hypothetical protein
LRRLIDGGGDTRQYDAGELLPFGWLRTGIGAVVAMVAAAMTIAGHRLPADPDGDGFYCWAYHFGGMVVPACGRHWARLAKTSDVEDIDCPHCLRMHAMVYGGAK